MWNGAKRLRPVPRIRAQATGVGTTDVIHLIEIGQQPTTLAGFGGKSEQCAREPWRRVHRRGPVAGRRLTPSSMRGHGSVVRRHARRPAGVNAMSLRARPPGTGSGTDTVAAT